MEKSRIWYSTCISEFVCVRFDQILLHHLHVHSRDYGDIRWNTRATNNRFFLQVNWSPLLKRNNILSCVFRV